MKLKKIFLFIVILFILLSGCLGEVPVLEVKVNVSVAADGKPKIEDVSINQTSISAVTRPRDRQVSILPAISCRAFKESGKWWVPASYWASAQFNSSGTYTLLVDFETPPNKGENLNVWVGIHDNSSMNAIESGAQLYQWK